MGRAAGNRLVAAAEVPRTAVVVTRLTVETRRVPSGARLQTGLDLVTLRAGNSARAGDRRTRKRGDEKCNGESRGVPRSKGHRRCKRRALLAGPRHHDQTVRVLEGRKRARADSQS